MILDRVVYNSSRVARLYGTLAAKGDNTKERPHRLSKILRTPDTLQVVSVEKLLALVEELQPAEPPPVERPAAHSRGFDMEAFLTRYGVAVAERMIRPDGTIKWRLERCVFNPDHETPDAAVFQFPDGKLGHKCFHTSCADKHWKNFRRHFEPNYERKTSTAKSENEPEGSVEVTSLKSYSSSVADYPKPMADAALYGLAGEIVRRIEPQTEADPAALFTVALVGLGNLIGHVDYESEDPPYHAYAIADGSYHFLNEFAVLVGPTGIGRKGTAQANVKLGFLQHVDNEWAKAIAGGLSSGEGLIWQVRDAITKLVRDRKSRQYETEIVDAGVEDKRLLVVESEFASVLKVMTREGNTLSPVLRLSWDGATVLRTLTKNSPAKATNALISMIGHITPEELRRWLNEIEAANGFGNRILWCACKRSKLLPEGGEVVGVADLIDRLQNAVKFARSIGRLGRDDAAKELWAHVYPKLTEGKPGLLGAMLARAEAHVLRISNFFAVLDMKDKVQVEHLHAALAAWDYYRRTVHWQFATGTGNRHADAILTALKAADKRGLTKWEIITHVFNRNVTKLEIDEALRLLFVSQLAYQVIEQTGGRGRPTERWFQKLGGYEENDINEENRQAGGNTSFTSFSSSPAYSEKRDSPDPEEVPPSPAAAPPQPADTTDCRFRR